MHICICKFIFHITHTQRASPQYNKDINYSYVYGGLCDFIGIQNSTVCLYCEFIYELFIFFLLFSNSAKHVLHFSMET